MSGIVNPAMAEHFDKVADAYEQAVVRTSYSCPDWVSSRLREVPPTQSLAVLDLACATGVNARLIREYIPDACIAGVDVSPRMIEIAAASQTYNELHVHDLNHPMRYLDSERFDLVLALGCLEFLTKLPICMEEIHRILKHGGTLWASFQRYIPGSSEAPRHVHAQELQLTAYSQDEIGELMLGAGLHVKTFEATTGYTTRNRFACPYFMVQAQKP